MLVKVYQCHYTSHADNTNNDNNNYIINLDSSDVDLRHALANMIAVVFGLPSRSTHLWYHMFSPGDLENSYLTGFMVQVANCISNIFIMLLTSTPKW